MTKEYSLADVLERFYQNQLAIEAALMELTLCRYRGQTTIPLALSWQRKSNAPQIDPTTTC